jgi:hypothetical protein
LRKVFIYMSVDDRTQMTHVAKRAAHSVRELIKLVYKIGCCVATVKCSNCTINLCVVQSKPNLDLVCFRRFLFLNPCSDDQQDNWDVASQSPCHHKMTHVNTNIQPCAKDCNMRSQVA